MKWISMIAMIGVIVIAVLLTNSTASNCGYYTSTNDDCEGWDCEEQMSYYFEGEGGGHCSCMPNGGWDYCTEYDSTDLCGWFMSVEEGGCADPEPWFSVNKEKCDVTP